MMGITKSGISDKIRKMVSKINEVGIKEVKDYYDKFKPKTNFKRQLEVVRCVAKVGYEATAAQYGISRQATEQSLKNMYKVALEIEGLENG